MTGQVLSEQRIAHGKLDEISGRINKLLISAQTIPITNDAGDLAVDVVNLSVRRFVIDVENRNALLETEVGVFGRGSRPITDRKVFLFLNNQPLASLATDESGMASLRDPIPFADLNIQRTNFLQARVDATSKAASMELDFFRPPVIQSIEIDPDEPVEYKAIFDTNIERYSFRGKIILSINPDYFLDVTKLYARCTINDCRVEGADPDQNGMIRFDIDKEYTIRTSSDGEVTGSIPYEWSKRSPNKLQISFSGLPDCFSYIAKIR